MDFKDFLEKNGEKPLDNLVESGGLCGIFRTIGCIGDSLSSGEFEGTDKEGNKTYHDFYEYSWGQYMAREAGLKVYNFSRGGMTAEVYWNSFAGDNGFWNEDKLCQAYIIALGVNDVINHEREVGSVSDIDLNDYNKNKENFAGYYAKIISRLKSMQPKARFFLMTAPKEDDSTEKDIRKQKHRDLLINMADIFDYTYVIDLYQYAPVYDEEFKKKFFLGGHMNAMGYMLTAKMVMSYIDYIIRNNTEDFMQTGFIGTEHHNRFAKW